MTRRRVAPQFDGLRCGRLLSMAPGRPVIDDGCVLIDRATQTVAAVGRYRDLVADLDGACKDLGAHTVAPGLVNCHTHLELSHMRGRLPQGQGFEAWVKQMLALPLGNIESEFLAQTLADCRAQGTAFVADITSRRPLDVAAACGQAGLEFLLFGEPLGFGRDGAGPPDIWPAPVAALAPSFIEAHVAAAGHGLYSTHPATLQAGKAWDRARNRPYSIHLAEHVGEVELLATGRGSFAELLRGRILPKEFAAPSLSPVAYADKLGLLDERTLAVHCVHVDNADIALLHARGVNVCLCPRSNLYIGVGRAPVEKFWAAGLNLCLATDSLASNQDLDLWNELRFFLENSATRCTLAEALALVTVNPAQALGIDTAFGTLEPGKRAAVSIVPPNLAPFDPANT